MTRGKFITVEGIDGAGKSSHLEFLCARARSKGGGVLLTREPGGTPLGESLRKMVLHQAMAPMTEALLMFGARSAHVAEVIEPALEAGTWVVCDRFSDSSYAYQCGGRGLSPQVVATLEAMVHPQLQPDATFLFDVEPAIAAERQRAQARSPDIFEREQTAFFERVREAYQQRARQQMYRFHFIDASGTPEQVRELLAAEFDRTFP